MDAICLLLSVYLIAVFARILMSWFPISPGTGLATVYSFLFTITEPILGPLRRAIPPVRVGMAAIDLSAIIVLIGGQILVNSIC